MRSSYILFLDALKVFLDKELILRDLRVPHRRFRLHQFRFAAPAGMPSGINGLGVPLELIAALHAFPYVLVVDGIGVFCCYFNAPVAKCCRAFLCPVVLLIPKVPSFAVLEFTYHCLNSFPCGLSFTPLTMKFAKWQNSWASTLISRSSSSMTFSASSIFAKCLYVFSMVPSGNLILVHSLLQFARPAVELSFLLQMILTPPPDDASSETSPFVIVLSSSFKNASAVTCLLASNAFFASMTFVSFFLGLRAFFGDAEGDGRSSSDSASSGGVIKRFLRGDMTVFRGEYWSFHLLITSCDQNASRSGLRGGVGICSGLPFEGEMSLTLRGLEGGVDGCGGEVLCGEKRFKGSLNLYKYLSRRFKLILTT
jgi:hypothetical protein